MISRIQSAEKADSVTPGFDMIDMTKFKGRQKEGRDYSSALRDLLPTLISETPMSRQEIAQAAGRDHETVSRLFTKIRSQIHIAGWRRANSGPIESLWLLGPGEDMPKPTPFTSAEKSARWRTTPHGKVMARKAAKRWRNSGSGRDWIRSYGAGKYARKKYETGGIAAIDPLLAAIMGVTRQQGV